MSVEDVISARLNPKPCRKQIKILDARWDSEIQVWGNPLFIVSSMVYGFAENVTHSKLFYNGAHRRAKHKNAIRCIPGKTLAGGGFGLHSRRTLRCTTPNGTHSPGHKHGLNLHADFIVRIFLFRKQLGKFLGRNQANRTAHLNSNTIKSQKQQRCTCEDHSVLVGNFPTHQYVCLFTCVFHVGRGKLFASGKVESYL